MGTLLTGDLANSHAFYRHVDVVSITDQILQRTYLLIYINLVCATDLATAYNNIVYILLIAVRVFQSIRVRFIALLPLIALVEVEIPYHRVCCHFESVLIYFFI